METEDHGWVDEGEEEVEIMPTETPVDSHR